jgi:hypothetical protein
MDCNPVEHKLFLVFLRDSILTLILRLFSVTESFDSEDMLDFSSVPVSVPYTTGVESGFRKRQACEGDFSTLENPCHLCDSRRMSLPTRINSGEEV